MKEDVVSLSNYTCGTGSSGIVRKVRGSRFRISIHALTSNELGKKQ